MKRATPGSEPPPNPEDCPEPMERLEDRLPGRLMARLADSDRTKRPRNVSTSAEGDSILPNRSDALPSDPRQGTN